MFSSCCLGEESIVTLTFVILIIICLGIGLFWIQLFWDPLCFLTWIICFFREVWEMFSYNFFKYIFDLFLLFLESLLCVDWHTILYIYIPYMYYIYPIGFLYCFPFSFFHLAFCLIFWLDNFHYSVFQITYSFFCIIQSAIYCL